MKTSHLLVVSAVLLGAVQSASAATITTSATAPTANVIAQGATDNGATSVRWVNDNTDTDLGSTFLSGPQSLRLDALTVRISTQDFGANVPGLPVVLDFFAFDGTATFSPLWRVTGNLPTTTAGSDFVRWDLTSQSQILAAGDRYGFLIGAGIQDTNPNSQRFRLFTSAINQAADAFEIRRDYEFGNTRPDLSTAPGTLNTGRDVLFFVEASAVPEPSSLALGVLGATALLARHRQRSRA